MALVIAAVNKGVSLVAEADGLVLLPEIFGSGPGDGGGEIRPEHEGISLPVKKFIQLSGEAALPRFPAEDVKKFKGRGLQLAGTRRKPALYEPPAPEPRLPAFLHIRRSVMSRTLTPGVCSKLIYHRNVLLFAFCFHHGNVLPRLTNRGYYTGRTRDKVNPPHPGHPDPAESHFQVVASREAVRDGVTWIAHGPAPHR